MKSYFGKPSRPIKGSGCARLVVGGVLFLAVLGMVGAAYQNLSMARDRKLYPPPGQLVAVGGYRLHLYCIGEGSPTVVLEAGSGGKVVIGAVEKMVNLVRSKQ